MNDNLENEIRQELEKEKFINFYKKYRTKLVFFIISTIILIFSYQFRTLYINKANSENIEKILLSQIYLDEKNQNGIKILNELKNTDNPTISTISSFKLIDYYLDKNDRKSALEYLIFLKKKIGNDDNLLELLNIKETIIKFDEIKEGEILNLLKKSEKFSSIKNKLLYDFYLSKHQISKAKQFKF